MSRFVKVMFGTTSGAKRDFEYKINEVNVSENWNPMLKMGEILEDLIIVAKNVY